MRQQFVIFSFADGTKLTFQCLLPLPSQKPGTVDGDIPTGKAWQIICEKGSWSGRALSCGECLEIDLAQALYTLCAAT